MGVDSFATIAAPAQQGKNLRPLESIANLRQQFHVTSFIRRGKIQPAGGLLD